MKCMMFVTDGAATTGRGSEINSLATEIHLPPNRGIRIMALKQVTGTAAANDAQWTLWVDYKDTGQAFDKDALLVTNDGGVKLGPTGLSVHPGAVIAWAWLQVAAQVNTLQMFYE